MITRAALDRLQPLTPVSVPAGELAALMDRAEADRTRVARARQALIASGYFTPDEVDDDIAPRIVELRVAYSTELMRLEST